METRNLGKYRLDGVLGKGAMGIVYKGFDKDIERPVALKVLHEHLLEEEMAGELAIRFRQEAQVAARCMHANIVTVFDYGIDDGAHYIVMEYIEGIDLKSLLRQQRRMRFRQAADTIFQVLSALQHAHANGVVHRDIKPANIMMLHNGQVKVTDFGIARLASSDLTQAGYVIGTPGYMSPEGARGGIVDSRSDLYSVAVVFHELLTGKRLQQLNSDHSGLRADLLAAIEDEPTVERMQGLLLRALEVDPAGRFEDAAQFARELGSILSPDHRHSPDTEELATTVLRSRRAPLGDLVEPGQVGAGAGGAASTLTPSVVSRVERVLASYVGPMASLLVRKYRGRCDDIDSLLEALVRHIPSTSEQTRFRAAIGNSGIIHAAGTGSSAHGGGGEAPARVILNDQAQQQIGRLLAGYIGPLAPRILQREQRQARDRADLERRLAQTITRESERREFLRKLTALQ